MAETEPNTNTKVEEGVIDLCESSADEEMEEEAKQPKMKKPKTSVSELNQDFELAKSGIKSKYDNRIKLLKEQMARETTELTMKHHTAIQEIVQYEVREKSGTLGANVVCGTCGKGISEKELENDEDMEKYFLCAECGDYHCNDHKNDTTECVVCGDTYCEHCLPDEKCHGCMLCPQLTCCTLKTMPCGEKECTAANCNYYHHKHCRCQSRNQYEVDENEV